RLRWSGLQFGADFARRNCAFHSSFVLHGSDAILSDRDHRRAGGHAGRPGESGPRQGRVGRGRGHGRIPRGTPAHFPGRRTAARATMSTHLGNGAHQILQRHPNYIWEQLAEDRLIASFIVDGIHLPASFLKVALRAKGLERSVLVTDASTPAAAKPGRYSLGEQTVILTEDNRVLLSDQD